jgi:hypothetical protein
VFYLIKPDHPAQTNVGENRLSEDRLSEVRPGEVRSVEVRPGEVNLRDATNSFNLFPKPIIPVLDPTS